MTIAVMQPYLFPYVGYFQLISAVDKFIFYDDVNFITRGWINRNNILINGKANLFTVPLKKASQNKLINEIEIAEYATWKNKFLQSIEHAYKKAPNFQEFFAVLEQALASNIQTISELATESTKKILEYLSVTTTIVTSSTIYNNGELKAQKRILDICLQEYASRYINPIGGIDIYDKTLFSKQGIQLNFLKTSIYSYQQFNFPFVANLSIIDILMFNSKEVTLKLLQEFTLV